MEILKRIYGHSSLVFDEPFLFGRTGVALVVPLFLRVQVLNLILPMVYVLWARY